MPTVAALLVDARQRLRQAHFQPSTREAALLLGRLLDWSEAQVLARDDREVPATVAERFEALVQRRLQGEPVAYLLGEREFYGRDFFVDARVLIPRPETEHLVESALERCHDLPEAPHILDVGAGSGCVAVTLASELPRARVTTTDISPAALAVTTANARRHGVLDRVQRIATDVAAGVDVHGVDMVVSNPPYIDPAATPELSLEVTTFEPPSALFASTCGTRVIRDLLALSRRLRAGTSILFEIGHDQADLVHKLADQSGVEVQDILADYAGVRRIVIARGQVW